MIGLVGFILFFSALSRLKASTASTLSYVEVLSGICFGIFLLGETLTWNIILGGFFIVTAAILVRD